MDALWHDAGVEVETGKSNYDKKNEKKDYKTLKERRAEALKVIQDSAYLASAMGEYKSGSKAIPRELFLKLKSIGNENQLNDLSFYDYEKIQINGIAHTIDQLSDSQITDLISDIDSDDERLKDSNDDSDDLNNYDSNNDIDVENTASVTPPSNENKDENNDDSPNNGNNNGVYSV